MRIKQIQIIEHYYICEFDGFASGEVWALVVRAAVGTEVLHGEDLVGGGGLEGWVCRFEGLVVSACLGLVFIFIFVFVVMCLSVAHAHPVGCAFTAF